MRRGKKINRRFRGFSFSFRSKSHEGCPGKTRVIYRQNIDTKEVGIVVERLILTQEELSNTAGVGALVKKCNKGHLYSNRMNFRPESLNLIMLGLAENMEKFKSKMEFDPTIFDAPLTTESKIKQYD